MDPIRQHLLAMTRRHFFQQGGVGLGTAALASFLPDTSQAASSPILPTGGLAGLPHFAPKAKRAIYLFMAGAPSQMDLFDYKPQMTDWYDKDLPESVRQGQRLTTMTSEQTRFPIAPSKFKFQQYGKQGAWISELLPYHGRMVDDMAIVKSVYYRSDQSRPGDHLHLHRQPVAGSGQSWGLAELWPRVR